MVNKALENKELYLRAPTWEEIESFVKECKVTIPQFERYFSIPPKTLYEIRYGSRNLPAAYWHVIYEKKIPTYGTSAKHSTRKIESVVKRPKKSQAGLPQQFDVNTINKLSKTK
jgi:hypothetical protein